MLLFQFPGPKEKYKTWYLWCFKNITENCYSCTAHTLQFLCTNSKQPRTTDFWTKCNIHSLSVFMFSTPITEGKLMYGKAGILHLVVQWGSPFHYKGKQNSYYLCLAPYMAIVPKSPIPDLSSTEESQNYIYHFPCSKVFTELLWTSLDVLHLQQENMPFVVLYAIPFSWSLI